jgi:hypothetical protein
MKPKYVLISTTILAVMLVLPVLSRGMSETFCSYRHDQWIRYNLTLLIPVNRTTLHAGTETVPAAPRPVTVIVKPVPKPAPAPVSIPRAMSEQLRMGSRALGLLVRISGRLIKHWLREQLEPLIPKGSD